MRLVVVFRIETAKCLKKYITIFWSLLYTDFYMQCILCYLRAYLGWPLKPAAKNYQNIVLYLYLQSQKSWQNVMCDGSLILKNFTKLYRKISRNFFENFIEPKKIIARHFHQYREASKKSPKLYGGKSPKLLFFFLKYFLVLFFFILNMYIINIWDRLFEIAYIIFWIAYMR